MFVGIGGILGQLLLLRELFVIYHGNELIIGIVLSNWLVFEAAGAYQGRKSKSEPCGSFYAILFMLYAIILPCSIFAARSINHSLIKLVPGESAPLTVIIIASVLTLAVAGYIHGFLFPLSYRLLKSTEQIKTNAAGIAYIFESSGTLIGGILFTFYLANRYDPFDITLYLFITHLILFIFLFKHFYRRSLNGITTLLALGCVVVAGAMLAPAASQKLQAVSLQLQWPNRDIVHYENTAYGNIVITRAGEEYTFNQGGRPVLTFPNPNWLAIEDLVNLSMAAHPAPRKVLVVGAGVGGLLEQLLKHPLDQIDYVEIDPRLIELYEQYLPEQALKELHNPKVRLINTDIRHYLTDTEKKYDCILVIYFKPETLQSNRLFTEEYFRLIERSLKPEGLFFFTAPGAPLKYSDALLPLNATLLTTAKTVFSHVEILPGELTYFYAGNNKIDLKVQTMQSRLTDRGLTGGLISTDYLIRRFDPQLVGLNLNLINKQSAGVNKDYHPVALYKALLASGNYYSPALYMILKRVENLNIAWVVVLLLVSGGLLFLALFMRREQQAYHFAIFSTGLTGMTFNLLILYAFQSLYGIIYQALGLFFVVFMAGIILGGISAIRYLSGGKAPVKFFASELFLVLLHPLLFVSILLIQSFSGNMDQSLVAITFLALGLLSGLAVGCQFPMAAALTCSREQEQTAGSLYAADLLGGWLGGMIVSVILYPLAGLGGTLLFSGLLKAGSLLGQLFVVKQCVTRGRGL